MWPTEETKVGFATQVEETGNLPFPRASAGNSITGPFVVDVHSRTNALSTATTTPFLAASNSKSQYRVGLEHPQQSHPPLPQTELPTPVKASKVTVYISHRAWGTCDTSSVYTFIFSEFQMWNKKNCFGG